MIFYIEKQGEHNTANDGREGVHTTKNLSPSEGPFVACHSSSYPPEHGGKNATQLLLRTRTRRGSRGLEMRGALYRNTRTRTEQPAAAPRVGIEPPVWASLRSAVSRGIRTQKEKQRGSVDNNWEDEQDGRCGIPKRANRSAAWGSQRPARGKNVPLDKNERTRKHPSLTHGVVVGGEELLRKKTATNRGRFAGLLSGSSCAPPQGPRCRLVPE